MLEHSTFEARSTIHMIRNSLNVVTKLLNDLKRKIYADLTHSKQRMREKAFTYTFRTENWVQFKCIHWGKKKLNDDWNKYIIKWIEPKTIQTHWRFIDTLKIHKMIACYKRNSTHTHHTNPHRTISFRQQTIAAINYKYRE